MLKKWRATWKDSLNGSSDANQARPSEAQAAEQGIASSSKRSRLIHEVEPGPVETDNAQAPKRRKIDPLSPTAAIASRLPEIVEVDATTPDHASTFSMPDRPPDYVDSVIASAKEKNTLCVVENEQEMMKLYSELLHWAYAIERNKPLTNSTRRKRIAILVTEDAATANERAVRLSSLSDMPIGVYTAQLHSCSRNSWIQFSHKELVIIPGSLLCESLIQGALAISSIYLMIIDDVLSLRENTDHPIRQIMQEFYRVTDTLSRPKMFGVISCAHDEQLAFTIDMLNIECILDARMHGLADSEREKLASLPEKPMELVVFYDSQVESMDTPLTSHLSTFDPEMSIFPSHFRAARQVLHDLGTCACDLVWHRALKEMKMGLGDDDTSIEERDEPQIESEIVFQKTRRSIRNVIQNWAPPIPNLNSASRECNVTPKFAKLVQVLKSCEPHGDSFKGIIIVQNRAVAYALLDLFRALDDRVGPLRPQVLVGHRSMDELYKAGVMQGFNSGLYNLLIVTKQAEDLELAPATIVIRFDLFDSQLSYAHCRTRARGCYNHLIHMAERGNDVHRRILGCLARTDAETERWIYKVVTSRESAVPPYPLKETVDPYRSDSDEDDVDPTEYIQDPTTGGRIYVQDATTVVYRFVSQLGNQTLGNKTLEPLFAFEERLDGSSSQTMYICTVLFPPSSPIRSASGPPRPNAADARRSTCYEACLELYRHGILDYRLFPRPPLPLSRPQRSAYISMQLVEELSGKEEEDSNLPSKKKLTAGLRPYPHKAPDFWVNSLCVIRGVLYPTIIIPVVNPSLVGGGRHAPMLFLTRLPLPPILEARVFFSGAPGMVYFRRAEALQIDEECLQDLCKYTIRLFRYITNKPYTCEIENMPYFLAPLSSDFMAESRDMPDDLKGWSFPNVASFIPWADIRLAASRPTVKFNIQDLGTLTKDTEDAMVQDRWAEFTRRYFCVRVRPDLNPLSKPADSPREKDYENLVAYCQARRRNFAGLKDYTQPLVEVRRTPLMINHLNPSSKPIAESKHHPAKYLIPELCAKCTIPASVYRTALLLPSILTRLDNMLLIKELNTQYFDHSINESRLLEAVSTPSADVEFNYERLELLGDAYLKYLSSIYLFVTFPALNEGALHVARQRIISNRSLLHNANQCGIPQYIQSKQFTSKHWSPLNFKIQNTQRVKRNRRNAEHENHTIEGGDVTREGTSKNATAARGETYFKEAELLSKREAQPHGRSSADNLEGAGSGQEGRSAPVGEGVTTKFNQSNRSDNEYSVQWLGDKAIADVVEAIIGAAYVTGGREVALKATKALNIPVPYIDRWSDFGRKALAPSPGVTAKLKAGSIRAVESIIGHQFEHPHLLAQALTHASIHGNQITTYERLEFIGDAILDFLVIRHIFDRDLMLSPGGLTLLKGAMVSNSALAAVCVWSDLYKHLMFESAMLEENIKNYADALRECQLAEYEQAAKENRSPGQYWVGMEPPKALSDVVESILGAVYVSDRFSPVGAEAFFDKVLAPFYDKHITLRTLSHHPTKILFELLQSYGCQEFELTKEAINPYENELNHTVECEVIVHDITLARATDFTPSAAARSVSDMALDAIQGDPQFILRNCDCRANSIARKQAKKASKAFAQSIAEMED